MYVRPLLDLEGDVIGVIQVDLGDIRFKQSLNKTEEQVLNLLCRSIGSSIGRIVSWSEARLLTRMDKIWSKCISSPNLAEALDVYVRELADAFAVRSSYIRLINEQNSSLVLTAGTGDYFKAALSHRKDVDSLLSG